MSPLHVAIGVMDQRPRLAAPITAFDPRAGYIDRERRKVYPWRR